MFESNTFGFAEIVRSMLVSLFASRIRKTSPQRGCGAIGLIRGGLKQRLDTLEIWDWRDASIDMGLESAPNMKTKTLPNPRLCARRKIKM